ncbi:MAG: hypothetical protein HGB06_04290 [Chlorobaculum sp.]|jgi:hypothetical protein|nr:hypothetical protein [Chlorobaculum sp.]
MVLRGQLIAGLLSLLLFIAAIPLDAEPRANSNAIHSGPCAKQANGRTVTLDITPRPVRAMQPLLFRVSVEPSGDLPPVLMLDFSMPGMYMGQNRMKLVRTASGAWEGRGVIVRCMSGKKLWQLMLLSPELGNPAFSFDVRD